jgi:hypothetical protein
MTDLSNLVRLAYGFKSIDRRYAYPCHYCGKLTVLLDAEDFHVCKKHQIEYIAIGHKAMKEKFPLAGEKARNPGYFEKETARYLARARRLTKEELHLLVERSCHDEQQYAQAILDGKSLELFAENELWLLGCAAEQYIDEWEE